MTFDDDDDEPECKVSNRKNLDSRFHHLSQVFLNYRWSLLRLAHILRSKLEKTIFVVMGRRGGIFPKNFQ